MSAFLPGLELSRRFYSDIVRPIIAESFPALAYAAALIGTGSEVLGFDTEMSTDHNWGPNVHIFLREEDEAVAEAIVEALHARLPVEFLGYAVRFVPAPGDPRSRVPAAASDIDSRHLIRPTTLRRYVRDFFGMEFGAGLAPADWLALPSQKLRAFTAGEVFEDRVGDLTSLRQEFRWYPRDVWLYLLAAGWTRIAQEEHLMPRAGLVGDALGSALIGARLVRDAMSLCFLMEEQYAPYAKWFGTAFRQLRCAATMLPLLANAQQARDWQTRMNALALVYERLAELHNGVGVTPPLDSAPVQFYGRPFRVIRADRFAEALIGQITDPVVKQIASRPLIGNIDQVSDNTDLRENSIYFERVRALYD